MSKKNRKRKLEAEVHTEVKKNKKKRKLPSYENSRKLQLKEANKVEDVTIKRLEKLLKIDKKKKKKASIFHDDGLDYIVDFLDKKEGDTILSDDSLDFEEDVDVAKASSKAKEKPAVEPPSRPVAKNRSLTELMKEKGMAVSDDESFSGEDGEESFEEEDEGESYDSDQVSEESVKEEQEESENENVGETKATNKSKVWEDIYGRLRDESGNVLKSSETSSQLYVPPKLRKELSDPDDKKKEECLKIKRQLKGLLNRLSESNIQNICHQIEDMYMKYSRNDMNETLFNMMSELVFTTVLTPPRLIMEQAMLVALLHANVGSEVGAYFLQHIVEKLGGLFKTSENYGEGKECNNVLTFLSHLYNFKVTHSTLIFDVFNILIESFKMKDIELIQLFLKSIGFVLRKDNPLKLKEIIMSVQAKAVNYNAEQNDSRVKFMLDTLTAIKNNNIYKIPDYDPSIIEHSKKLLKGLVRKGSSIQELSISYQDLLNVEERGRWWIIGSAWADDGNSENKNSKTQTGNVLPKSVFSEKILELARKQHMNTDVRKSVFCIIMTAEDFMDAFEKLLKLNLKNQQKREIINVLLHCLLQEKQFNPYYAYLAKKFCEFCREYRMTLQFSLWDKFKDLMSLKSFQVNNLAQFLSLMFISGALPISILKTIQFSDMNKVMVKFFRKILLAILLHNSEEICEQVFKRIAPAQNLKLLRESLKLFMQHFLLRNQSKLSEEEATKLKERIKLAISALNSFKNASKL